MIAASVLAALGAFFGFANPLARVPGLILLFPAGLAYMAYRAPSVRLALKYGYWTGFAASVCSLYWTAIPVHYYGFLPWWMAAPIPALMSLYLALFPGAFTALVRFSRDRLAVWALGLFAGCLWAALEMLRGSLFTGFPWLTAAAALAPWPFAIQGAAYLGAYGLSGFLAGCASLAVFGRRGPALAGAGLVVALFAWGAVSLRTPLPEDGAFTASVIQGNVEQARKWDPAYQEQTVSEYLALSQAQADAAGPALMVWPETAMPFYLQKTSELRDRVTAFARDNGLCLVTGAPAAVQSGKGYVFFNRAFLIGTDGELKASYDKRHLVPFGEYVPFGDLFPFISKLAQGAGDFKPGTSPAPLKCGDLALGMLICYEAIFPELAQERVAAGANVLVNISNDAWFGDSPAPRQHLDLSLLRAVEQGRYLIRATNTGVSAFIDPKGRVLDHGGLFVSQGLSRTGVGRISSLTFFHRFYGILFISIFTCAIILPFASGVFPALGPRRPGRTSTINPGT